MPSKKDKAIERASQREKMKLEEEQRLKEEIEWEKGTNKRAADREAKKNQKFDEKMAKASEMKMLLAEDEVEIKGKKTKLRKQKGDSLDLLNKALAEAPKSKKEKEKENRLKQLELNKQHSRQKELDMENERIKREKEAYLLRQKGIVENNKLEEINNTLDDDDIHSSGIDAALNVFSNNQNMDIRSIYKSFYDEQLMILKENSPGLRLSQYNDKIHKLWKNSNLNPNKSK